MSRAPTVIHQYGRPMKARDVDGREIIRENEILFNRHMIPCLEYDSHFVYKTSKVGSPTLMCTCGSASGVIGYRGYKQYASYMGSEVIACLHYTNYGVHADGSH